MPNEPSKDSSLFPSSDGEREDSGLQDILAVAAKIKDKPSGELEASSDGDDDGVIMFTAGGGDDTGSSSDEDDALFASFSGGLAFDASDASGGMGGSLVDEVAASSASAASPVAPAAAAASEDDSRKPLVVVAVVLGLALVGIGGVFLLDKGEEPQVQQQAQAEMSAPGGDQVAAKAEEPEPAPAESAGAVAPEPEPAPEEVADTEELDAPGETEGLGAMGEEEGDPLGTKANLLDKKDSGIAKAGKWDQGESVAKPTPEPEPIAQPEPEPDPLPLPEPSGGGGNKKVSEDDVDCLLNPDLPKCQGGKPEPKKQQELLAPKVPDKLSSQQLRAGFNGVKPAARQCGLKNGQPPGTKVKVHVSIEGPSGKVTSVKAKGEHAGTPLGTCVESAVKGAQFEVFKKPAMGIDYTMVM